MCAKQSAIPIVLSFQTFVTCERNLNYCFKDFFKQNSLKNNPLYMK